MDTEPSSAPLTSLAVPHNDNEEILWRGGRPAAWVDSDDERMTISLAGNSRLRKLRQTEADDIVSGTEYTKRLRLQFERLRPPPQWAEISPNKRRKLNDDNSASSNDDSEDDLSNSMDDISTQPLAELLRSTGGLISTSTLPHSQKKLRPEIIDIHRLKDVGDTKPVRTPIKV